MLEVLLNHISRILDEEAEARSLVERGDHAATPGTSLMRI